MEPLRQDQATHQDKVRVSPFGIIRIDPGRIIQILPGHNPNMTLILQYNDFAFFFWTKWSLQGRTRILTKTRLESLHSVLSEYDLGRIIEILPGHNPNMTPYIRIQRFCLFFDKMEPPRQDQIAHQDKVRAPPFGIIWIWPDGIIQIVPGHNPNMTLSIRLQIFCLFFDKMDFWIYFSLYNTVDTFIQSYILHS
jgi:hypothetical protein